MVIGILSVQGALEPHERILKSRGINTLQVKKPKDLEKLAGIILPGGESTSMIHLLKLNDLWQPLKNFAREKPTWGVCAGVILLASKVTHPQQESLEVMNLEVERNSYGRQRESFVGTISPKHADWKEMEGVFIRAPRILKTSASAQTLLEFNGEPVLIEDKNVLVSTFHPELTSDTQVHSYFIKKASTWMTSTLNS